MLRISVACYWVFYCEREGKTSMWYNSSREKKLVLLYNWVIHDLKRGYHRDNIDEYMELSSANSDSEKTSKLMNKNRRKILGCSS